MKIFTAAVIALAIWTAVSASITFGADNGDGTYTNPILFADYPDSEVIRVGDDFYYQSSSFHLVPGNPVMHSRDLVNWEPAGFSIPDYKILEDARYDLDGETLRPYFPLEAVREGIFALYGRLYGLHFEQDGSVPVYHE
ncbi:MAG: family 43 glycosylhydrolase, partial [Lentisphaeria bacterium]|nr:family 43 glycosylhydrolase [Lentisphaeria bacterium]